MWALKTSFFPLQIFCILSYKTIVKGAVDEMEDFPLDEDQIETSSGENIDSSSAKDSK